MYFAVNKSRSPSASNSQTLRGTNTNDHTPPSATPVDPILLPIPVTAKLDPSAASTRGRGPLWPPRSLKVHWVEFKKRLGTGTAPSTSSLHDDGTTGSVRGKEPNPDQLEDEVDEVVVDREWTEDTRKTTTRAESANQFNDSRQPGGTNTDRGSFAVVEGFWARSTVLIILRWRLWPAMHGFFRPRFMDAKSETQYNKESWFYRKRLAVFSALFFICNWITACVLVQTPVVTSDVIFYYVVRPYSSPHRCLASQTSGRSVRCFAFRCFSWSCTIFLGTGRGYIRPTSASLCGPGHFTRSLSCKPWVSVIRKPELELATGTYADITTKKNLTLSTIVGPRISSPFSSAFFGFLLLYPGAHHATFSYACALQTMALFGLNLERFPAMVGMVTFFVSLVLQTYRVVQTLTRTPSARAPCSFPSGGLTPGMLSISLFSKLSCSTSTTSGNMWVAFLYSREFPDIHSRESDGYIHYVTSSRSNTGRLRRLR